jgi:hypothetical protein
MIFFFYFNLGEGGKGGEEEHSWVFFSVFVHDPSFVL